MWCSISFLISRSNRFHFEYVTLSITSYMFVSVVLECLSSLRWSSFDRIGSEKLGFTAVFIAPKSGEEDRIRGRELALLRLPADRYQPNQSVPRLIRRTQCEGGGAVFDKSESFISLLVLFFSMLFGGGGGCGFLLMTVSVYWVRAERVDTLNRMDVNQRYSGRFYFHRNCRREEDLPFIEGLEVMQLVAVRLVNLTYLGRVLWIYLAAVNFSTA